MEEVAEVARVLTPERTVEIIVTEQFLLDEGGRGFFCVEGAAGLEPGKKKSNTHDREEHEAETGESFCQKANHRMVDFRSRQPCSGLPRGVRLLE